MVGTPRLEAALRYMEGQGRSGRGCDGVLLRLWVRGGGRSVSIGYVCNACQAVALDVAAAQWQDALASRGVRS